MEKKTVTKPVLRYLNDHCRGGFILISFDEDGLPQMNSNFDSGAEALALQFYTQNWAKAIEAANVDQMARDMISDIVPPKEGEEGEGEEEI